MSQATTMSNDDNIQRIRKVAGEATHVARRQARRAATAAGTTVNNARQKMIEAQEAERRDRAIREARRNNPVLRNEDMTLQTIYLALRLTQIAIRILEGYLLYTAGKYMAGQNNWFVRVFGRTLRLLAMGCIIGAAVLE